jgi:hypothetical protein
VKVFTSHLKPGAPPVLVAEGFSLWAALFGWLWLLFRGAWLPAILLFAVPIVLSQLVDWTHSPALVLGLLALQGFFGRDLVRWHLARTGYEPGPVVAAADHEAALARLVTERADLFPDAARALG